MAIQCIQPGKPIQNDRIERFNRLNQDEVLDQYLVAELDDVREADREFLNDYDLHRPLQALDGMTPVEERDRHARSSTFEASG
ncbi:transposase [Pseudomarimonas salicorniae]|uniref:Transposase n=1 Tax=Pseudomarimonas salicorniae TaxID=2933270 RepID=A0ABT0GFD6_9GAMM|nr:transposase [Lysobacter sp. CAU 1642]MCK7592889.1 transposase [Lysobacter sp. CAU 1642]